MTQLLQKAFLKVTKDEIWCQPELCHDLTGVAGAGADLEAEVRPQLCHGLDICQHDHLFIYIINMKYQYQQ